MRWYRLLLLLYPARFRDEYQRELERQFRDEAQHMPAGRLWRRTFYDVLRSAPRQHCEELVADVRHSLRSFGTNPGFTAAAVGTLALGIGVNALVFSVINTLLFQPVVFSEAERLVHVWEKFGTGSKNIVSATNAADWRRHVRAFDGMGIFVEVPFNISAGPEPQQVSGLAMSAELFRVLGIAPMLGRTFESDDERNVVVVSHDFWRNALGANPNAIGSTIRINSEPNTVIGVMPRKFRFPFRTTQLWKPLALNAGDRDRSMHSFYSIARLKPGVSVEEARREVGAVADRLRAVHKDDSDHSASVSSLVEEQVAGQKGLMFALMGAVSLLLLMAVANVANLLLARNSARAREFAVRAALGATPWRVVRQLMTESLLLAGAGCAVGVALCVVGSRAVLPMLPSNVLDFLPYRMVDGIVIDERVLAFAVASALLAALFCSIPPAWQMIVNRRRESLVSGGNKGAVGASGGRIRSALVAVQVALCVVVLTAAGLMIATMSRLLDTAPGFRTERIVTMSVSVPQENDPFGVPERVSFCRDLRTEAGTAQGVRSISAISHVPLIGGSAGRSIEVAGLPPIKGERRWGHYHIVCPGFFQTMGIRTLAGRDFDDRDTATAPGAVIINETLAKKYWPGANPVGSRVRIGRVAPDAPWLTVIGVVSDVRHFGLGDEVRPTMYRTYAQAGWPMMTVVAETQGAPATAVPWIVAALRRMLPDQPVRSVRTMEEAVSMSVGGRRFPMMLLVVFAVLGLTLAAVGIYGVVSYSVAQRTQELGVRLALGASRSRVWGHVAGHSLRPVFVGVLVGVGGALVAARALESVLYGVRPDDPSVLAASSLVLLGSALAAVVVPARRACSIDPVTALRYE